MPFDFTEALAQARKTVHATFGVPAMLQPRNGLAVSVSVRLHGKTLLQGDLENGGFADVIEGIDRLVFNLTELSQKSIQLRRGDQVALDARWQNVVLTLQSLEPPDGPEEVIWRVNK